MDLFPLEDDCIRVCLTEGEHTVCATVSSHHLVPDKERQLKLALAKEKGAEAP